MEKKLSKHPPKLDGNTEKSLVDPWRVQLSSIAGVSEAGFLGLERKRNLFGCNIFPLGDKLDPLLD